VLADDRHYFPPYDAVPLFREQAFRQWPQLRGTIAELTGKISAEEMRRMNEAVDAAHRDPAEVVREFRARKGL
jgi:osmoprotectant transport system substrate-binding protein